MIMHNGKQVGFIQHNNHNIDKRMHNGVCIFEQGYPKNINSTSRTVVLDGTIGKPLKSWTLSGNNVGDLVTDTEDENYGKYKIPITVSADGLESITKMIYISEPLKTNDILNSNGTLTRADGTTETVDIPEIPTFKNNPTINGITTSLTIDTTSEPSEINILFRSIYK